MTKRNKVTIADRAYLAGIIDGEGSIVVSKSTGKNGRNTCYQPFISVSNTEKSLIDWLYSTFGGTVTKYTPSQMAKNCRKQVFKWQVTGKNIDMICALIRPYSTIKVEQIDVMIRLRATYNLRENMSKAKGGGLSKDTLSIRQDCFDQLKLLHNRS